MGFMGLDAESGISSLDQYIQDKSYVEGVEPSQADVSVFEAIKTKPDAKKFPNAARWYSHIESKRSSFSR